LPELRKDAVTGTWVIVAAERSKRPHDFNLQGHHLKHNDCIFCYGNENKTPPEVLAWRPLGGEPNTPGWTVRAFPNKFPAVTVQGAPDCRETPDGNIMTAVGAHEVIVDCPDHSVSFGQLSDRQAELVIQALVERFRVLSRNPMVRYIQVFKNCGTAAGSSIEHVHWQLISVPVVPENVLRETAGAEKYREKHGVCGYCRMISGQGTGGERVIETGADFVVFSPFASRFPYETWILPRRHEADFRGIGDKELTSLGRILRKTVGRIEQALDYPPYNIVLHSAPLDKGYRDYHWHLEIMPRLSVAAGFELGTGVFINPVAPEISAAVLREADPGMRQEPVRKGGN